MATIYDLMQTINPDIYNNKKSSLQEIIYQQEAAKRQEALKQKLMEDQAIANSEQAPQNLQANIAPAININDLVQAQAQAQTQPQSETRPIQKSWKEKAKEDILRDINAGLAELKGMSVEDIWRGRPKIKPEQEPYQGRPKPYTTADFGKYFKKGKGFWGKTKGALADILMTLNTPEGMKLLGGATYALGGNIYTAKALADQGDIIAQRQLQEQQQYNNYIKELRDAETAYDLKAMDILGKEAYAVLKGGKDLGLLIGDKQTGRTYLPKQDEEGNINFVEVDKNSPEYKNYKVEWKYKAPLTSDQEQEKTYARGTGQTRALLEREEALRTGKAMTAAATTAAKTATELKYLPAKKEIEKMAERDIVSGENVGRVVLANTAVKDIEQAKNILFPTGKPESFRRDVIIKSKLPITGGTMPFDKESQEVSSRLRNAIAAKVLLQTGVAARPEEVDNQYKAYIANWQTNPKAALDQFNRLQEFYISYLKTMKNKKIGDINIPKNLETTTQDKKILNLRNKYKY